MKASADEQVDALFQELKDSPQGAARDALVERFLPLARSLAERYRHTSQPLDDLFQVASLGLVKAVDRFDPERGVRFSSFAVPTILGELKRHFRDLGWSVRVPRGLQERALQVERVSSEMSAQRGTPPPVEELAAKLDIEVEDVLEAMEARQAYDALSTDAPQRAVEGEAVTLGDGIGEEDPRFELVEDRAALAQALQGAPTRDRYILYLRFVHEMTQSQIAERLDVSQMQVSRLLRQALQRLRKEAES